MHQGRVDVTAQGRTLKRGVRIWSVGVSLLKSELYHNLKLSQTEEGFPPNYCHFPEYSPEYFKQLTAEHLITKIIKGYPKQTWQKIRDCNEALDCRIYARAASIALGIDRFTEKKWKSVEGNKKYETENNAQLQSKSMILEPKLTAKRRILKTNFM